MNSPSLLGRMYNAVALFALVNMLALGGLVGYLVNGGALNMERARGVVAVLKGEFSTSPPIAPATPVETIQNPPISPDEFIALSVMQSEIVRREVERGKTELDQRMALNNAIMVKVTSEREALHRERELAKSGGKTLEQKRVEQEARDLQKAEVFKKQVAIYEGLSPRVALEHLQVLKDADEAARILLAMETRKAEKIVGAAKNPAEMESLKEIMKRMREVPPDPSLGLTLSDDRR